MDKLDRFYTSAGCAERCVGALHGLDLPVARPLYIEPSAGDGVFFDLLPKRQRVGVDLHPAHKAIQAGDFLAWRCPRGRMAQRIVIGNPPFGKSGKTALRFLRHASSLADTVAFILPMSFRKFAMHKHVPDGMALAMEQRLPKESFRLPDGRDYVVNTVFQVWTRHPVAENLRRMKPEAFRHHLFDLFQYNNTAKALTVFDNVFDFAVPCQGWQDYRRRETDASKCEKNKQWMLVRARTKAALQNLRRIDYERLALTTATTTPGFRKGDLVEEYVNSYG